MADEPLVAAIIIKQLGTRQIEAAPARYPHRGGISAIAAKRVSTVSIASSKRTDVCSNMGRIMAVLSSIFLSQALLVRA